MKKKKLLAMFLTLGMTLTMLSGCGNSSGGSTGGTGSSESGSQEAGSGEDAAGDTADAAGTEDSGDAAGGASLEGLPETVGEGTITATPEMYSGVDLSDPYTVNMYLIGDTPNDWEKVLGLANDYLKPFNTELAVTFMSWSDYQTMYSLVLAGGEQVDLIFTAPWCYMYTEAAKGTLYELTDDFIARMVPGVLSNSDSAETESFSNYLLEYPQYSRPESWMGKKVPEVLLSGDHRKVDEWRLEQSLKKTKELRPDLYEKWERENQEYFIRKGKREARKRKKRHGGKCNNEPAGF